ncbi:sigma factor-like helix-turn-helix DNA-binding protein [Azorhizobium oxalatiphilum]|uniref:sigma factor-like helix-turn-helix DNA-binding protein n=1 Tax=Azorhizobium oxalatiphilum TaxID=980631 RepID=UPI00166988E8|nr:sigma factor-like helix-turn-helix DNA-binding protein [Azorhizobium oxalatiphilum]
MTRSERLRPIIADVADRRLDAMERLYQLSSPKLYGLCLRILRRPELAKSALKTAYLKIWKGARTLPADLDPLYWMVCIVRESALETARTNEDAGESWEPFEVEEPAEDPLAEGTHSDQLKRLLACLGTLSEERRRMVLLAFYDGWSREALSVYFDAPMHTVNTWLKRSVAEIDEQLSK